MVLCSVQFVCAVYDYDCRFSYELWDAGISWEGTGIWFETSTGID